MMSCVEKKDIKSLLLSSLKEDIGCRDVTSESFIPKEKRAIAVILAKQDCVVCGIGIAAQIFKLSDKGVRFKPLVKDGKSVKKGVLLARISGNARSILCAERVVLNFLTHLSGISTITRAYAQEVKPFKAKILDTRKTTPGLRLLEKYAVRIGGGFNHRLALDEMVMLKDNHLMLIGGIKGIKGLDKRFSTEIEVKNLREFSQAFKLKPDMIMLDNMGIKAISKAVKIRGRSRVRIEASGSVTLKKVRRIAATGVDFISIGALTHSVPSVDISLEVL